MATKDDTEESCGRRAVVVPGLGIGVAAFCVYLVGEQIYSKALAPYKSSSHHNQKQPAPSH
ncbi:hypothetical protein Bca52824_035767 [Brassica carinata]|uniref:Uncharacterized protein n=1 Tax=Brassica carinata TaxID=52824 RepID=A0A8X7V0Y5_BRACI|nr:hypothetical protein Bca52824_035767 [Brassica carinata]